MDQNPRRCRQAFRSELPVGTGYSRTGACPRTQGERSDGRGTRGGARSEQRRYMYDEKFSCNVRRGECRGWHGSA
eukprot:4058963-Prymnesium_polylepis.1